MELPFFIVERAHDSGLQPSRDAVEVERVIANSPRSGALFLGIGNRVCLAINAGFHDMILADRAVVNMNIYSRVRLDSQLVSVPRMVFISFRMSYLPQAQRATAFHFFTSNLFSVLDETILAIFYDN